MTIDELKTLAAKLTDEVDAMQRMLEDLKGDHERDLIALSLCQKAHDGRILAERERIARWLECTLPTNMTSVVQRIRRGSYP